MWATLAMGPARKLGLLSGEGAERRLLRPAEKKGFRTSADLPFVCREGDGLSMTGTQDKAHILACTPQAAGSSWTDGLAQNLEAETGRRSWGHSKNNSHMESQACGASHCNIPTGKTSVGEGKHIFVLFFRPLLPPPECLLCRMGLGLMPPGTGYCRWAWGPVPAWPASRTPPTA